MIIIENTKLWLSNRAIEKNSKTNQIIVLLFRIWIKKSYGSPRAYSYEKINLFQPTSFFHILIRNTHLGTTRRMGCHAFWFCLCTFARATVQTPFDSSLGRAVGFWNRIGERCHALMKMLVLFCFFFLYLNT